VGGWGRLRARAPRSPPRRGRPSVVHARGSWARRERRTGVEEPYVQHAVRRRDGEKRGARVAWLPARVARVLEHGGTRAAPLEEEECIHVVVREEVGALEARRLPRWLGGGGEVRRCRGGGAERAERAERAAEVQRAEGAACRGCREPRVPRGEGGAG